MSQPSRRRTSLAISAARLAGDPWLKRLDNFVEKCCAPEGLPRHLDARKIYRGLSRSRPSVPKTDHVLWKDFRAAQAALLEWMKGKKHWKESTEKREYKKIPNFGGPEAIIAIMILDNDRGVYPQCWGKEWAEMRLGHVLKDIGRTPIDPFWKGAKLESPEWRRRHLKNVGDIGELLDVTGETRMQNGFRNQNKKDVLPGINDWARIEGYNFMENLDEHDVVFKHENYRLSTGDQDAGYDERSATASALGRQSRPVSSASRSGPGTSRRRDASEDSRLERRGLVTPARRQPVTGDASLRPYGIPQRQGRMDEQPRGKAEELRARRLLEAMSRRSELASGQSGRSAPIELDSSDSSPSPVSKVAKKTRKSDQEAGGLARQTPREGGANSGSPTSKPKSANRLTENSRPMRTHLSDQMARTQLTSGPRFASPALRRVAGPTQLPTPSRASVARPTTPAPKKPSAAKPPSPARNLDAAAPRAGSASKPGTSTVPPWREKDSKRKHKQPTPAPVAQPAVHAMPPGFNSLPPRPNVVEFGEKIASLYAQPFQAVQPAAATIPAPSALSFLPVQSAAAAATPAPPIQLIQPAQPAAAAVAPIPAQPAQPVVATITASPVQAIQSAEPAAAPAPSQPAPVVAVLTPVEPAQSVQPAPMAATTKDEAKSEDKDQTKPDPALEAEKARIKKHYLAHLDKKYTALQLLDLYEYLNSLPAKFWEGPMNAAVYERCAAEGPKDHNGKPAPYHWPAVLKVLQEMFRLMGFLGDDNKLIAPEREMPRLEADEAWN